MSGRAGLASRWRLIFAFLYFSTAGVAAWQTIRHTDAATSYFEQLCEKKNLRNEGAQVAAQFEAKHEIAGFLIGSYLRDKFKLPSLQESTRALGEVPLLEQGQRREDGLADLWSWLLLGVSLAYLAVSAARRGPERARNALFAFAGVSAVLFVVGITSSAMMILTSIKNFSGTSPIIQHEARSVFSVIMELFSTGHWIFGGFITLFSVLTPCTKISLTFIAATTSSSSMNLKISRFLTAIDKWSMTDVFVAAVLLACFTVKSGDGTQVIPYRGLYYFAGYCLLSMITTSLLTKIKFDKEDAPSGSERWLGIPVAGKVFAVALFLAAVYTLKKQP